MASDLEQKAKDALIDDNFELAVDLYTQAISINPNLADLYADRAQAYFKLDSFPEAVADSNRAIELNPSSAKAYFRKGLACMKLEEYQTAKSAFEIGASLNPGETKYLNMIKECDQLIAEELGAVGVTSSLTPHNVTSDNFVEPASHVSAEEPVVAVSASTPKYRHEFYQKADEVVVTIFARRVPADCVSVQFGEQILSISITVPGEDPYNFQPRLFGKIVPDRCTYSVLSMKVEIRLVKADAIHWASLEYSKETSVVRRTDVNSGSGSQRPSYPSSKSKGVNWDELEAQVKKQEKEEKLDGDAGLNKFFREIFSDADDDTRRAMQKSFVESNGTVLSTNWKEVGSKKVEGSAPDGMELKKWEY